MRKQALGPRWSRAQRAVWDKVWSHACTRFSNPPAHFEFVAAETGANNEDWLEGRNPQQQWKEAAVVHAGLEHERREKRETRAAALQVFECGAKPPTPRAGMGRQRRWNGADVPGQGVTLATGLWWESRRGAV